MINIQILSNCQLKIILSLYHNNIHRLAIEIYKVANGICPEIMNYIFKLRQNNYNLRGSSQFLVDPIYNVFNGSESESYLGTKVPTDIKNKDSLIEFKKEIKKWKPLNCSCRICKTVIPNLRFYLVYHFYQKLILVFLFFGCNLLFSY